MTQFAVVLASLLAVGAVVTKTVDFIRNLADPDDSYPKWVWNLAAFAVGIAYCLGFQVDLSGAILALVPALVPHSDRLTGVAGQVFTGLLAGGAAGFAHEVFDALSGIAKRQSPADG